MTECDDLRERFPSIAAGDATAADMERLEQAMAGDPQLRRDFIEFMNLDAALEDWAAAALEVRPLRFASGSRHLVRRMAYAAYAAVIPAAVFFGWMLSRPSGNGMPVAAAELTAPTQATLVVAEQCRWSDRQYHEGQRLPAGRVRLLAGNAVIRLDGGTLLMLRGDCDLDIRDDGGVDLRRGEIAARSADDATGFVVHAPGATIVDLGTEFALRIDELGRTEVHVVEGSVRLEREGMADGSEIVNAERAVRIDREKSSPTETIAYGGEPMAAALQRMRRQQAVHDVLVGEPFDYPSGNHAPTLLDGGRGWRGPWRLPLDRDGAPLYPGTQRLMSIVEHSARGRVWETPAGKSFRARSLAQPIDLAADGVLYLGLTIHAEQPGEEAGAFDKQGRSVRLVFRTAPSAEPDSISFGFNNVQRPIIETSAGRSFVGRTTVPMTASVRLVAKILMRAHGEDELSLIFLDEQEKDTIEPAIWDVASRGVQLAARLQDVFLASHGPAARRLDDLRIGVTWWSVLEESPSP